MDGGIRSLPRELERAGTELRHLASAVKIWRVTGLRRDTGESITDVSVELGYSSPANFARVFRKATVAAPHNCRANSMRYD
ncbi:helix-turn-helix domain-containing protein [Kaistia hirudinis]